MAQVKDLLVQGQAKFLRKAYFQDQIVSNVAQGTAPLVVASSTVVSNLNSDYLDGYHASGLFTALSANSTLSITIGGTTLTSSINAATVDGKYISNYYTKSEADDRFVNVAGDTMSGALIFSGVTGGNYNEGIRIQDASNKWAVITFGATGTTGCSPQSGEVAWVAGKKPGGKFLISPNTSNDTIGLRLEKDGNAYWRNNVILHSGNYTSYLGYIGTTAVQASSAPQALSGITSINSRLSINAESDNTRLGFGGLHGVTFGEPGYAHRTYFFRPSYGPNGVTHTSLVIQDASAAASPTFTDTHRFDYNGNAYHSGNIYLDTGDSDRFIQFRYNSNNYAGASWRLLSRGSGSSDTNYFDIETGGSNASNNTWYRVIRLTMDNRYVGIGTDLPTYKLHIAGDSYTTGWSRAANGFYVEGTGVHFTHQGGVGEIDMTSNNEFLWGSSTATLYFNHRAVSRGTTVNNYIWNAGSSTSWASHNMGNIWLNGGGVYLRLGPQNTNHAHYETTASISHWFNKRVDVNGDIWRYGTNYGIASDGQFYAKAIYANRDSSSTYGGISLYSTSDPITEYGIAFRGTVHYGKIGRVQGGWATYFTMDPSYDRGWIFRSGGTNYASVSARGEAYFNSVGTDHYIAYPSGGFFSNNGSTTGYIIITIPANYRSSTMMRFNVEIYNYSTGTSTTYTIGGYNFDDGKWYNVFAYANRQGTTRYGNLTVRFGHNGTNSIIWIGESNTSYSYPKVRITNVTLGQNNTDYNTWAAGWSVTIATTAPTNVSQTVTNPATNYYAESAGSAGNAATATNADKLDGYHKNDILRSTVAPTSVISLNDVVTEGIDFTSWAYAQSENVNNQPGGDGVPSAAGVVSFGTDYPFQIYSDFNNTSYLYYRSYYANNGWKAWRQFAFLDSNVASSSKWATPRTITLTGSVTGSVSIDGSQNVSLATTTNHTHSYAGSSAAGGDATRALAVADYGDTRRTIQIGYAGTSLNTSNLTHIAGYTNGGTQIKDVPKSVLQSWLGLGSAAYTNSDAYAAASHTHSYLPLTGGTITGYLTIKHSSSNIASPLIIDTNSTVEVGQYFRMSGTHKGWIGYRPNYGMYLYTYNGPHKLGIKDDGIGYIDTNTILHSGNYNSYCPKLDGTGATGTWGISITGNAGNADKLDNIDSTGFYRFSHISKLQNKDLNYANNQYGTWNYGDDSTQKNTPTTTYGCYLSWGDLASSDTSTRRNQTAQIGINCWNDLGRMYVRAREAGERDVTSMGSWRTVAFTSDIPTSLPANGGNADTVDSKHASDFAPAGHTHDGRYQVISSTTASGITSLATGSYSSIHISTGSGGTMSFSSTPASGKECHIVIYNSGSSNITITLPRGYRRNIGSITIASGAFGEVNVLNTAGTIYIRAV